MFLFILFQIGLYLENYSSSVNGPCTESSCRSALGRWTSSFIAAEKAEKETDVLLNIQLGIFKVFCFFSAC